MALRSQNGLSANDRSKIGTYLVPGTSTRISVRKGNVATVLLYVASEFDKHVEDIDTPSSRGYVADHLLTDGSAPSRVLDDWSFAVRNIRGSSTTLSNHASGSAIDLNATQHPLGTRGNYTAGQLREIRKILAFCDNVVRAGVFYTARPDPMHFEINANAVRVALAARKIRKKWASEATAKRKAEQAAKAAVARKKATALAKAKAKAAAALATSKRKAAAVAAATALAALAAGGAAVVTNDPKSPAPVVTASPTATPTVSRPATPPPTPKPTIKPTPATKPKPVLHRTLRYTRGKPLPKGIDVRRVQSVVGARADGVMGPLTVAKIKSWQRAHNLKATGTFGRPEAVKAGWVFA